MQSRQSADATSNNVATLQPANKHAPLWDVQRLKRRAQRASRLRPDFSLSFLCVLRELCGESSWKSYSSRWVVSTCLAIASAKPSIVYSRASMFGLNPACRSVSLVTGPIDASQISRSPCQWSFSRSDKKFVAVDELVNVTISGR